MDNLGLAIKVALDFGVKKNNIVKTIPKINFEGRVQYINKGKLTKLIRKGDKLLIDGCHSETSAENLNNYLRTLKKPIYGIWGMQKNKTPEKFYEKVVTEDPDFKGAYRQYKIDALKNVAVIDVKKELLDEN